MAKGKGSSFRIIIPKSNYVIDVDEFNFILKKLTTTKKSDKEIEVIYGYYSKITYLLEKLIDLYVIDKISEKKQVTLVEYLKCFQDTSKEILDITVSLNLLEVKH